jgi:hypothetical protein
MKLVIVESPYAADPLVVNSWPRPLRWLVAMFLRWRNVRYARRAMHDCIRRGEFPIASHLLYTQPGILRDEDPVERHTGITAGLVWAEAAQAWARVKGPEHRALRVVYIDRGLSRGIHLGIQHANAIEQEIEYRSLAQAAP